MSSTSLRGGMDGELDLGQALGALLRSYFDGARPLLSQMPGGPRGYQVMTLAASERCANQAEIAWQLGLDRTAVTHVIDELEQAELVERQQDPSDRRSRRVVVTEKGQRTLSSTLEDISDVERGVLAALTRDEASRFRELLAKAIDGRASADGESCLEEGQNCAEDAESLETGSATPRAVRQ